MDLLEEDACPVAPGDVLLDKYQVESFLGGGGMGVVVAAKHLVLGERVALKFLRPKAAAKPEHRQRFLREAQAAARIQGEHVVRVYDVAALPDGTPFLVMEHLSGRDLRDALASDGPLSAERAATVVLEACEALAQAHALGIVHRDLKPGNLFLSRGKDGVRRVKVLDFGISKLTQESAEDASLTRSQGVIGSPLYMSPEQVRASKTIDARADIWSLGIILHGFVAGTTPFQGDAVSALFASIAADEPIPLARAAPGAPAELGAVIARCLRKTPDERFASTLELARALAPLAPAAAAISIERIAHALGPVGDITLDPDALPTGAEASKPTTTEGTPPTTALPHGITRGEWGGTASSPPLATKSPAPSPRVLPALGVVALLALVAGAALLFRDPPRGSVAQPPSPPTVSAPPPAAAASGVTSEPAASASPTAAASHAPGSAASSAGAPIAPEARPSAVKPKAVAIPRGTARTAEPALGRKDF